MPWTFAHPAAVLPLRRLCGSGRLCFAALVVGSLSPDFGYSTGPATLAHFAHAPLGIPLVCLPLGLLVLLLAWRLQRPIAELLPEPHRTMMLEARPGPPASGWLGWLLVAVSLMLGAATHQLWDSFTHEGRLFVELIPVLREPLFEAQGRQFRVFNLLQHLSTVFGLLCLAIAYRSRLRRRARPASVDRRAHARLAALLVGSIAAALPCAWLATSGTGTARPDVSVFIVQTVLASTTLFFVALVVLALWREYRRR